MAQLAAVRGTPSILLLLASALVAAAGEDGLNVITQQTCEGSQTEYSACPDLPECIKCVPDNCGFQPWGDWAHDTNCTGLCSRSRSLNVSKSRTGCSRPCSGTTIESKECIRSDCKFKSQDCVFGDWHDWTECKSKTDQKTRVRVIKVAPRYDGKGCYGGTSETEPCSWKETPKPCEFTDWQDWVPCSRTCGGGVRTRARQISSKASDNGEPCRGPLWQEGTCNKQPCTVSKNCLMGDWSPWKGCDDLYPGQQIRQRSVLQPAQGNGTLCDGVMKEAGPCPDDAPVDCTFTDWTDWDDCDKTCDGGQTVRIRHPRGQASNGGQCLPSKVKETKPCRTQSCHGKNPDDCQMSSWSLWSTCSTSCGMGARTRERSVTAPAKKEGQGCEAPLQQIVNCTGADCPSDCKWEDWSEWGDCSTSCGGGNYHRTRTVEVVPTVGGKPCSNLTKAEVAACNTQSCDANCVDGALGDWSAWSECSMTCDMGVRSKKRDVARQPNSCGKPASGPLEEYEACSSGVDCVRTQDCKLSDWDNWGACSTTCFGIRQKHRKILQARSGAGKPCKGTLTVAEPCYPSSGEAPPVECTSNKAADYASSNCVLEEWGDWSKCSATCDGGQHTRTRGVFAPRKLDGAPCQAAIDETAACNTQTCVKEGCVDCIFGPWGPFGACTSGGGSQRFRTRKVQQKANHCGNQCVVDSLRQTDQCPTLGPTQRWCAWTEWSSFTDCPSDCGPSTQERSRELKLYTTPSRPYLFSTIGEPKLTPCSGSQVSLSPCESQPCKSACVSRDCQFGQWSDWDQPTAVGLQLRRRTIDVQNNECGDPCAGNLVETQSAVDPNFNLNQDCVMSDWEMWGACSNSTDQRYRRRQIQQPAVNGGQPCVGSLEDTSRCVFAGVPTVDCTLSSWSAWGKCSQSCGGGWQSRFRRIKATALAIGVPCQDSLEEMQDCGMQDCGDASIKDCVVSGWQEWSDCDEHFQRVRVRTFVQAATNGGNPCQGPFTEMAGCEKPSVDCLIQDWTPWSTCDVSCGSGQHSRHRQVDSWPENGGKACPGDVTELMQTEGCNVDVPCPATDCELTHWSEWGVCFATDCGVGQQTRERNIWQTASLEGKSCTDPLSETKNCTNSSGACAYADCVLGDWEQWTACSKDCGGGTKRRNRIIQSTPTGGGKQCPAFVGEEVKACNTHRCGCYDAEWSDWGDWEQCSSNCEGGLTFRSRLIAIAASSCGNPVAGPSQEAARCNVGVPCTDRNCVLSLWADWSDCSASCDGVMHRSRHIASPRVGSGKVCEGSLTMNAPCNPSEQEALAPLGCPQSPTPIDCMFREWDHWDDCTASCGGGQKVRSRSIKWPNKGGGKGCDGSVSEIAACSMEPCPGPPPLNCVWDDWGDWGECDQCGGQRTRIRRIKQHPVSTGKACDRNSSMETAPCPRRCYDTYSCQWSDWEPWECKATCGKGQRTRRRSLKVVAGKPLQLWEMADSTPDAATVQNHIQDIQELYLQTKSLETHRTKELVAAFACGAISLVAALGLFRVFASCRNRSGAPALTRWSSTRIFGLSALAEERSSFVADARRGEVA